MALVLSVVGLIVDAIGRNGLKNRKTIYNIIKADKMAIDKLAACRDKCSIWPII